MRRRTHPPLALRGRPPRSFRSLGVWRPGRRRAAGAPPPAARPPRGPGSARSPRLSAGRGRPTPPPARASAPSTRGPGVNRGENAGGTRSRALGQLRTHATARALGSFAYHSFIVNPQKCPRPLPDPLCTQLGSSYHRFPAHRIPPLPHRRALLPHPHPLYLFP